MQRVFSVVIVICAVFHLATAATDDFRKDALDLHNRYRAEHNSPPLALSDELNKYAQNWADRMALSNDFEHSNGKWGENIYMSSKTKLTDSQAVIEATNMWYNEKSRYNYRTAVFSSATGHFTQVVWSNTKYLGIGVARSKKGVYVCANYDPRGNVLGQFVRNVLM